MTIFKLAWQAIAKDWAGFELWMKVIWITFFPILYLLVVMAVALNQPKKGEK